MARHIMLTALTVAVSMLTVATSAMSQMSEPVGTPGVSPATPPTLIAPLPSVSPSPVVNQPGVPNTSTPGLIGTSASPSGLPGDSTHHPGFPARGGRH